MRSPLYRADLIQKYLRRPRSNRWSATRRPVSSVAFYTGRDDLISMRSKQNQALIDQLLTQPRTVVLFTHRHSLEALRPTLPAPLKITEEHSLRYPADQGAWVNKLLGETPWGVCDIAVVERR